MAAIISPASVRPIRSTGCSVSSNLVSVVQFRCRSSLSFPKRAFRRTVSLPRPKRLQASVGEDVKNSAATDDSTGVSLSSDDKAVINDSDLNGGSPSTSPLKSGKIASRIAANQADVKEEPGTTSLKEKAPSTKPSFTSKRSLAPGFQEPFSTGKLSSVAADRLRATKPSVVSKPAVGQGGFSVTGKRIVDAFKEGDKGGKTTKFGQPVVPANIFDDVRRTPEEVAADAFKFSLAPGQIFLIFSFLLIIGLMLGTAFIVWKVGAIHYNEY